MSAGEPHCAPVALPVLGILAPGVRNSGRAPGSALEPQSVQAAVQTLGGSCVTPKQ